MFCSTCNRARGRGGLKRDRNGSSEKKKKRKKLTSKRRCFRLRNAKLPSRKLNYNSITKPIVSKDYMLVNVMYFLNIAD